MNSPPYEALVPPNLLNEFRTFVDTGDASEAFLGELAKNDSLQRASDLAFAHRIAELTELVSSPAPAPPLASLAEALFRHAAELAPETRVAELNAAAQRVRQDNPQVGAVIEDLKTLDSI